jgi:threonine dehydratase
VIGVEPEFAADAQASLRSGRIVSSPADQVSQTLADGLRTQSVGVINFEHIQAYVDDIVTVTEAEIRETMRALSVNAQTLSEPSGAVALAAFAFHADELPETAINVAVVSGGNIDPKLLDGLRNE